MAKHRIVRLFGEKIKRLREEKKLSQEQLTEKAGVHRTYVGMIERGEKNLTLVNIDKLARALDVPITRLFFDDE